MNDFPVQSVEVSLTTPVTSTRGFSIRPLLVKKKGIEKGSKGKEIRRGTADKLLTTQNRQCFIIKKDNELKEMSNKEN